MKNQIKAFLDQLPPEYDDYIASIVKLHADYDQLLAENKELKEEIEKLYDLNALTRTIKSQADDITTLQSALDKAKANICIKCENVETKKAFNRYQNFTHHFLHYLQDIKVVTDTSDTVEDLQNKLDIELDKAKGLLEKCVEPMLRYKSCLKGYAKESAHKGKRDNQKFWEQRTKKVAILQQEIEQALESKEVKK